MSSEGRARSSRRGQTRQRNRRWKPVAKAAATSPSAESMESKQPPPAPHATSKAHPNRSRRRKPATKASPRELTASSGSQPPQPSVRGRGGRRGRGRVRRRRHGKEERKQEPLGSGQTERAVVLAEKLRNNSYECPVCYDVIGRRAKTWSCTCCYAVFHLACITKWARQKEDEDEPTLGDSWRCPSCLEVFDEVPTVYHCFCGKVVDPPYSPHLTPHACDSVCGRLKAAECSHPCVLPCHPGSCPPCPALGRVRHCPCGRMQYRLRCGAEEKEEERRVCEAVCGRELSCGKHFCEQRCHRGACTSCEETSLISCLCGATQKELPCGSPSFRCETPCGRSLDCGLHECQLGCHSPPCPTCSLTPQDPQVCACGQTRFKTGECVPRESCLEPLPTCDKPCSRVLSCGLHRCKRLCHLGPCGDCRERMQIECDCGVLKRVVACAEYRDLHRAQSAEAKAEGKALIQCKTVCRRPLSCGNHKCKRRCCPAARLSREVAAQTLLHRCSRRCGRPLECGNHHCEQFCHLGFCDPCSVVHRDGISCHCGRTKLPGPQRCGTAVPTCRFPCSRPRSCEHPCRYNCHEGACPPCAVLVSKPCAGEHTVLSNIPCHIASPCCGAVCGRLLRCGTHHCKRRCHAGPCLPPFQAAAPKTKSKMSFSLAQIVAHMEEKAAPVSALSCGGVCGRERDCGHTCPSICHPEACCPPTACKTTVQLRCPCGHKQLNVWCSKVATTAKLVCDANCERQQRLKQLRDAFDMDEMRAHCNAFRSRQVPVAWELVDAVKKCGLHKRGEWRGSRLSFVEKMECVLAEFVHLQWPGQACSSPMHSRGPTEETLKSCFDAYCGVQQVKGSGAVPGTLSFKPMKADRRWIIHQLAQLFQLRSESFDEEPKKFVRLRSTPVSSCPPTPLSALLDLSVSHREQARRRCLPPSHLLHVGVNERAQFMQSPAMRLRRILHRWEENLSLCWLDSTTAIVCFARESDAETVLRLWQSEKVLTDAGFELLEPPPAPPAPRSEPKEVEPSRESEPAPVRGVRPSERRGEPVHDGWSDEENEENEEKEEAHIKLSSPLRAEAKEFVPMVQQKASPVKTISLGKLPEGVVAWADLEEADEEEGSEEGKSGAVEEETADSEKVEAALEEEKLEEAEAEKVEEAGANESEDAEADKPEEAEVELVSTEQVPG